MKEIAFPQFRVQAPDHWFDVTNELEGDEPPATLAADEGLGALQFSIAELPPGKTHGTSLDDLRALLKEFAQAHDLGAAQNVSTLAKPRPLLTANFQWDGDFLKVWYLADQGRIVFATYTCDPGVAFAEELSEAEQVVRSVVLLP